MRVITITIKNEMGAVLCECTKCVKTTIAAALIEYLKDYDIILEQGDTIEID